VPLLLHAVDAFVFCEYHRKDADALGVGGGRKVDTKILPYRQSIGTEEQTGSHARPTVDQLEATDYGTLALIIQQSLRRHCRAQHSA
jgi:hypothetical protein